MDALRTLFVLARDDGSPGGRAELAREHRRGRLHRVSEGAYLPADVWDVLNSRERHLAVAHAAQLTRRRRIVFSHWTAAAAWGLPLLESPPSEAHALAHRAAGGRTDARLVRHCVGIPADTEMIDDLEVTTLARTAVDVARVASFAAGVVTADAALTRLGDGAELAACLGPARARGIGRARRVIEFADGRSGSPGESLSRASMAIAGIPAPLLQHRFEDREGAMFVDFWWPRFNLVGEFDGAVKYDDPVFLAGRTPQQALLDEKHREDRVRALGPRVTRWRWGIARSPARLRAHLLAAGIRDVRYRNW